MIAAEKLQAAQTRTAKYYLKLLRELNQAYHSGADNTFYALQRFELDYKQIASCIEWLEKNALSNIELAQLFVEFSAEGQSIFLRRLKPVNYLHLYEKALYIAEQLQDSKASLTHLSAIAHAYQMLKNTVRFQETLVQSYELAKQTDNKPQVAASLLSLALLYMDRGQLDNALEATQEALRHFYLLNDSANITKSLIRIGKIYLFKGDWEQAVLYYDDAYTIASAKNYQEHLALILRNLGEAKACMGLYDEAIQDSLRALEIAGSLNDQAAMLPLLMQLANWHDCKADYATAQNYHHKVLQLAEQTGISRYKSMSLYYQGLSLGLQGDNASALAYLEESVALCRQEQDSASLSITLAYLTLVYARLGHFSVAQATLLEALTIACATKNIQLQQRILVTAAQLWLVLASKRSAEMQLRRMKEASRWFGLIFSLPNVVQELINALNKLRPELETALGREEIIELFNQGQEFVLQDVLDYLQTELSGGLDKI